MAPVTESVTSLCLWEHSQLRRTASSRAPAGVREGQWPVKRAGRRSTKDRTPSAASAVLNSSVTSGRNRSIATASPWSRARLAVVTEFTVAAARTRWRLQLASCDPDGPIRGSIEQDGLDPYAQAGFDVEYASQTQKLDGGWLLLCGPGRCLAHVRIGRRWW